MNSAAGVKLPRQAPAPHAGKDREQEAKRRKLREDLREQNLLIQRNKEALCDISNNRLSELLQHADSCLEQQGDKDMGARDAATHSEVFCNLTGCVQEQAGKLVQKQKGFTPADLIVALRAAFVHTADPQRDGMEDKHAFKWREAQETGRSVFRPAPGMSCMLGPLDAKPKERKAPAPRQKKQELHELVVPDEVQAQAQEENNETSKHMTAMLVAMCEHPGGSARFVDVVCNPASYSQTVENIFALTFLVRDRRLGLVADAARGLRVQVLEGGKKAANGKEAPGVAAQASLTFDWYKWDEMRQRVDPSRVLMPHRESTLHNQGHDEPQRTQAPTQTQKQAGAGRKRQR